MRPDGRDPWLVAALAALVHVRTVTFGFIGLDDRDLIVSDQAFLARSSSVWRAFGRAYMAAVDASHAYYRPVVTASYALDAQWSGMHAAGYHATNVALHVATCVLVLALLRRMGVGRDAALVATLCFALNPVLSPCVAWIPGRNDTLLALLAIAAWLAYLRGTRVVHLLLFALALLTKETAVVLPLIWATHALLLEPARSSRRDLAVHAVAWTALVAARAALHPSGELPAASWAAVPSLLSGIGKLALDVRPTLVAVARDIPVWPGLVTVLALGLATARLPRVRGRVMALGMATVVLSLLPPLLLTGTLVLGTRLYLPAVGAALILGELVQGLACERRVLLAFAGVTLVLLAGLTVGFEGTYRDRRTFAREAVSGSPHSALAHFCLGQSEQLDGNDDGALAEYREALALGPAEVVHNNIAVIDMKRAQWSDAEIELRQELERSPRYCPARYNLAIVLRREERADEACAAAVNALGLCPGDPAIEAERARDCQAR